MLHNFYVGRIDLTVLTIDPSLIEAEVIWEDLYHSGVEFPHIYGRLDLVAVVAAAPLLPDAAGRFDHWRA